MGPEAARGIRTPEGVSPRGCSHPVSDGHSFSSSLSISQSKNSCFGGQWFRPILGLMLGSKSSCAGFQKIPSTSEVSLQCGHSAHSSREPSPPTLLLPAKSSAPLLDNSGDNSHLLKIAGADLAPPPRRLGVALASFLWFENMGGFLGSEFRVQESQAHSPS